MSKELEFTGQLAPGDTLVIDTGEKTMLKNAQNAVHEIEGLHDFDLTPGAINIITYEDSEGSRQLLFQIRHRGRWS